MALQHARPSYRSSLLCLHWSSLKCTLLCLPHKCLAQRAADVLPTTGPIWDGQPTLRLGQHLGWPANAAAGAGSLDLFPATTHWPFIITTDFYHQQQMT